MNPKRTSWLLAASASLLLLLAACTPSGPANGTLALTVSAPSGVTPNITVSGPSGNSSANASANLSLKPGTYTITAANVQSNGYTYGGTASPATVVVQSSKTVASTVTYAATTGKLTITLSLPTGVSNPGVTVSGPGGFSQSITTSPQTLTNLAPGDYTITAPDVPGYKKAVSGGGTVTVIAGQEASGSVAYTQGLGTITVNVSGLPPSSPQTQITLTQTAGGSYTASQPVSTNGPVTFNDVPTGTYTVSGAAVALGSVNYTAANATATLANDGDSTTAALTYVAGTRSLTVTVTGAFKAGAKLVVTATPSSGTPVTQTATATANGTGSLTLSGLPGVDYTVSAQVLTAIDTYASAGGVPAPIGNDTPSVPVTLQSEGWLFAAGNGKLAGDENILAALGSSLETPTPSFVADPAFTPDAPGTTPAIVRVALDPANYFYIARQRISSSAPCLGGASCDAIEVYTPASYTGITDGSGFAPTGNGSFTIVTSYSGQPATISDLAFTSGGDLWVTARGSTAPGAEQPGGLLCYSQAALTQAKNAQLTTPPNPNPTQLQVYQRYYTAAGGVLDDARALAFDAAGNLWVASATKISRIPASALTCKYQGTGVGDGNDPRASDNAPETVTPDLVLTLPPGADIFSLAFDPNRNSLWATDYTAGSVFEIPFSGGANATSGLITTGTPFTTGLTKAAGLLLDKQGHLWVGTDNGASSTVQELIPGTTLTAGRTLAIPASYPADQRVGITSLAIATKALP
ncbi:hypothetical protein [Meiothermus granaticius]|uniref:Two component regulator propeller n=1 Tax=Meiothermus granaticius NBRC 107808 TaxID=1227551 RepID=A0A399F7U5_9DEIN|nr:hypothetical protein [Meiothermus granaticius]RIH92308.1 Two component regulator propeller [Meiothermus granaticius NBRC 107808]GEM88046.1 hypothetical protein MGR01S_26710 [Meiothermus granaticius NBRC 107808]